MYFLTEEIWFPPASYASPDGVLAIGGDLSPQRLELAYRSGIFPWYSDGEPIIWFSPDPRMILFPEKLKVSKSMQQIIRSEKYTITFNTSFSEVISNCKTITRKDQTSTWITQEMQEAYIKLHELGIARSVEVWRDKELVGGLYGVDLGTIFSGESMFSKEPNTSKLAFIYLVEKLKKEQYKILDCQIYNRHLASLGAEEISRKEFLKYI